MKKIPFKDIHDEDEFWCGAIFRKEDTTLNKNNIKPKEDFYEYMIFLDNGNSEWMYCARIDKFGAGHIISYVNMVKGLGRLTIKAKEFKRSMILDNELESWYFMEGGTRNTRILYNSQEAKPNKLWGL